MPVSFDHFRNTAEGSNENRDFELPEPSTPGADD